MVSMPASAASGADSAAQIRRFRPCRRAPSATAIVPATGRTRPSSESSPTQPCSSSRSAGSWYEPARSASAIGRSNPDPSLRSAAGARLTVIRFSPGPREHRVDDAAVDAMLRLLAGAVGEPDDRERGQIGGDEVRLDLDAARLEADDGGGEGAGEHTTDGTWNVVTTVNRLRAESVPKPDAAARRGRLPAARTEHATVPRRLRRGRSASDGDENRLVVLAGAPAGAAVHVALVAVDEPEPGPRQDLGIEVAPVVDDDAHPPAEHERRARVLEHAARCRRRTPRSPRGPFLARAGRARGRAARRRRAARTRSGAARGSRSGPGYGGEVMTPSYGPSRSITRASPWSIRAMQPSARTAANASIRSSVSSV